MRTLVDLSRSRCFDVSSPSSGVARNRPSSSLPYGSSSRCTPRIARGRGYHRWIEPSGSLSLGSGRGGRTTSSSFVQRPWSAGTARASVATGDRSRHPDLADLRSRKKRRPSSSEWRPRTAGVRGRSRPSCRSSGSASASRPSRVTSPRPEPDPSQQQRWMTFLRNHKDVIAGMDFFVVPTVRFRLLYVWFAIDHGRRRILHFNVTENPTARWVIQQLRETFPNEPHIDS